jgi:hypothetical protein
MQENLLSLDDVKTHFEHWRTTRIKQRERIPQYLWEEVKTLLDRYLLSEITTALRINTSQIKDNLKITTKINFAVAQIDTLNSPSQSTIFTDTEPTCAIESRNWHDFKNKCTANINAANAYLSIYGVIYAANYPTTSVATSG